MVITKKFNAYTMKLPPNTRENGAGTGSTEQSLTSESYNQNKLLIHIFNFWSLYGLPFSSSTNKWVKNDKLIGESCYSVDKL